MPTETTENNKPSSKYQTSYFQNKINNPVTSNSEKLRETQW